VNENSNETTTAKQVELCLLRHADAGDPDTWRGDDAQRPLSDKGRRQASALGRFLSRRGYKPDAIVSSPKMRSRQTAELLAAALSTAVELDDRLVGTPDLARFSELVEEIGMRRIVFVGHDPEFSELAAELIGAPEFPLKKATLVRIDVTPPLRAGGGTLRWLLPADLVG
jgi:phosphohistidine phosphatase